jgi:hypothetical protein
LNHLTVPCGTVPPVGVRRSPFFRLKEEHGVRPAGLVRSPWCPA